VKKTRRPSPLAARRYARSRPLLPSGLSPSVPESHWVSRTGGGISPDELADFGLHRHRRSGSQRISAHPAPKRSFSRSVKQKEQSLL